MFQTLRQKFGPITVSFIIGFIAFVFVFFGFYTPGGSMFGGTGGAAAMVNGDAISVGEFSRAYESRMQFYEGLMKGKVDAATMARLGLKKAVLDDLVRQKVLTQEAQNHGLVIADQEIARRIAQMPYFQKEGRFDKITYQETLKANGYSAGRFEDMIREEIALSRVSDIMRSAVKVSEDEVRQEFLLNANQRQVEYVLVTPPQKSFDPKNPDASRTASKALADEVLAAAQKSSGALASVLKAKKLTKKTSEKFSQAQGFIPGLGDVKELREDAFNPSSALQKGPKAYDTFGSYVVALGVKSFIASEADYPAQKDRWLASIRSRKERQIQDGWVKGLVAKARVSLNDELLQENLEDEAPRRVDPVAPKSEEI